MTWWQAIILGALQGITEFLPISSSGHLVLAQYFLGFQEDGDSRGAGLFFDGCLHLGTVVAVLLYFRQEIGTHLRQHLLGTAGQRAWPATWRELLRFLVLLGLATIPAAVAAILASDHIKASFEKPLPVAINFLILGCILIGTDRLADGRTTGPTMRWWQALLVGCGQAVSALFRGLSRSGLTISTALGVGLERNWAVRFSFMMSVIASLGLGGLGIFKALSNPESASWLTSEFILLTIVGTAVSAAVGYLSITPLITLVRRSRLRWFAFYLWLVGGITLAYLLTR